MSWNPVAAIFFSGWLDTSQGERVLELSEVGLKIMFLYFYSVLIGQRLAISAK